MPKLEIHDLLKVRGRVWSRDTKTRYKWYVVIRMHDGDAPALELLQIDSAVRSTFMLAQVRARCARIIRCGRVVWENGKGGG